MKRNEQYQMRFTMKAEGEDAEIMLYSVITSDKWFDDEIDTAEFDKALKAAKAGGAKNLNIRINSPGGEVYAAVAMRSMVINAGFDHVRIMIEGLCASAATLFATIPDAEVVIAEGSEFMIHNPMTIAIGNAQDFEKIIEHLNKLAEQFHSMYAAKTGLEEAKIKEWMDATTWFTAKEAVDYGFCDEILASEPVAACVKMSERVIMESLYGHIPEQIETVPDEDPAPEDNGISNETPVAGESSEINSGKEEPNMELENLTIDQLQEGNAGLVDQIRADAIAAERERLADIDTLTIPGYEDLAEQAKADGTSAFDFQKQLVVAMKAKGNAFLEARKNETAPAQDVVGGDPVNNGKTEEQEIQDVAKDIARYATGMKDNSNGMF